MESDLSLQRQRLAGALAARAVDLAAHDATAARRVAMAGGRFLPLKAPSWPEIEARVFILSRRPKRPEPPPARHGVKGAVPLWMIRAAARANLGILPRRGPEPTVPPDGVLVTGARGRVRGASAARQRLRVFLELERTLRELGEGVRGEELGAAMKRDPGELWLVLRWAAKAGALVDLGDLGWFVPNSGAHRRAEEFLAERERRAG
ncbi:hypothetical protein [Sorangium sp. So ce1024]|uniref:hypothetical protein n=1 Tax=Sorangium sp. So ce1024 TaxID=3133327 RepID=UPI003F00A49C